MREDDERQTVTVQFAILCRKQSEGSERDGGGLVGARIPNCDCDRRTACVRRDIEELESCCGGGSRRDHSSEKSDEHLPTHCASVSFCYRRPRPQVVAARG